MQLINNTKEIENSRVKNWWNSFSNAVNKVDNFIWIAILSSKQLLDDDWQKKEQSKHKDLFIKNRSRTVVTVLLIYFDFL